VRLVGYLKSSLVRLGTRWRRLLGHCCTRGRWRVRFL